MSMTDQEMFDFLQMVFPNRTAKEIRGTVDYFLRAVDDYNETVRQIINTTTDEKEATKKILLELVNLLYPKINGMPVGNNAILLSSPESTKKQSLNLLI